MMARASQTDDETYYQYSDNLTAVYEEQHIFETDTEYDYSNLDTLLYAQEKDELLENIYDIPTAVCGVLMGVVASVGIVANIITAYIFSRRIMGRTSISVLLTGLAITDALLLLVAAPLFASSAIYVSQPGFGLMTFIAYMTSYVYPVASALQTASVWLMTVTTMERYLAVCKPFLARTICTKTRALRTVAVVLTVAVLYNACRFWEYKPTPLDSDSNVMAALPAKLRANPTYILVYVHWMYFVFIFAIPFFVLFLVNGMIVVTIRRAKMNRRQLTRQQRKEHATATMMIIVALAYLVFTSMAFVLNAMELSGASGGQDVNLPQTDLSAIVDAVLDDTLDSTIRNGTNVQQFGMEQSASNLRDIVSRLASDNDDCTGKQTTRRHSNLFYFLIDLNNLLVMIHCSANFFIYYNFSQRFRTHVRTLILRQSVRNRGIFEALTADGPNENYKSFYLDEVSRRTVSRRLSTASRKAKVRCASKERRMTFSHRPLTKSTSWRSSGSGSSLISTNSRQTTFLCDVDEKRRKRKELYCLKDSVTV